MYWSDHGIIEGAQMDGENRTAVASLVHYWWGYEYDARGLALDIEKNRIYFVSYYLETLCYVDLESSARGVVQRLFYSSTYLYAPRGVEVDDQFVYWNDFWTEKVYRINKTAFDNRLEVIATGLYSPRGMAVKKGIPQTDSEYQYHKFTYNNVIFPLSVSIPLRSREMAVDCSVD